MAAKKKGLFDTIETESVYNAIAEATAEPAAELPPELPRRSRSEQPTAEEVQAAREQGKTQGRKGIKAIRINMAFTPEAHEYINIMARARGQTITSFCNEIVLNSKQQNLELFQRAKEFLDNFEKGT